MLQGPARFLNLGSATLIIQYQDFVCPSVCVSGQTQASSAAGGAQHAHFNPCTALTISYY